MTPRCSSAVPGSASGRVSTSRTGRLRCRGVPLPKSVYASELTNCGRHSIDAPAALDSTGRFGFGVSLLIALGADVAPEVGATEMGLSLRRSLVLTPGRPAAKKNARQYFSCAEGPRCEHTISRLHCCAALR